MTIQVTTTYESATYWKEKTDGAIFVKEQWEISHVLDYLIIQDEDWDRYKHLVQILPEYKTLRDLEKCCMYCGKTRIYDMLRFIQSMQSIGIDVFILQTEEPQ